VYVGTSGFSYDEWRGRFYPKDLSAKKFLAHYAGKLDTVEINSTFYRLPKPEIFESWAAQVPNDFRFTLKASRWMSHHLKVSEPFFENAASMKHKLGVVLVQVPKYIARDVGRIEALARAVPSGRLAFEFVDPSWYHEDTYRVLRDANAALSITEAVKVEAPLVTTARFAYVRLRLKYSPAALAKWAEKIRALPVDEVFVYFKHKESVSGPLLAQKLKKALSPATPERAARPRRR
jgi:uncharacterized protein YecE (DUF72 family)